MGRGQQGLLLGGSGLLQLRNQALQLLAGLRLSRDLSRGCIELGHEGLGVGTVGQGRGIDSHKWGELLELLGNRLG